MKTLRPSEGSCVLYICKISQDPRCIKMFIGYLRKVAIIPTTKAGVTRHNWLLLLKG